MDRMVNLVFGFCNEHLVVRESLVKGEIARHRVFCRRCRQVSALKALKKSLKKARAV